MNYDLTPEELFTQEIQYYFDDKLRGDGYSLDNQWGKFLRSLNYELSWGYSNLDPYISGNYAVFMQHGRWFDWLKQNRFLFSNNKYISSVDSFKLASGSDYNILNEWNPLFGENLEHKFLSKINLSRQISDIGVPEPNKEYIPISTRQRNSFVNTRSYVGSDFNMNWIETKNLEIFKYHEAWQKMIDLIRDGKVYIPDEELSQYMVNNPYSNTIWIAIFDPRTVVIKGLIALFGVLPVNLPFKTMVGDRSSPKITNYSMNYKVMDVQYAFYDDWEAINSSKASLSNGNKEDNLANRFKLFLNISDNNQTI